MSDLRLHKVLMNFSPAHLHLKVSNVNVYDIGTSKMLCNFITYPLLKYLFIMVIIVSGLVFFFKLSLSIFTFT